MSFAIIALSGHQYRVSVHDQLTLPGILGEKNAVLQVKEVLLSSDKTLNLGQPYLNYRVTLKIISLSLTPKLRVFTYKSKSRYRKTRGFRAGQTLVEVISIEPVATLKATK